MHVSFQNNELEFFSDIPRSGIAGSYGSSGASWWLSGKESACDARAARDIDSIPESEDPLEEDMATHSSVLAWRIPWTEEPGGLQVIGSQRVWTGLK